MSIFLFNNYFRKIFKSIEAKLNAQNSELAERGKIIEELKTSLSLFIDKYNKVKDDYEKEKEMGINIALSFAKGTSQKNNSQAQAQMKSFSKPSSSSRLIVSKTAILTFKAKDTKKNLISALESEKTELSAENSALRKQIDQLMKSNSQMIEDQNEIETKLESITNKGNEEIAALKQLNNDLINEKNDLLKSLQLIEKSKDEMEPLTLMNADLLKRYQLLEIKSKEEIHSLNIVNTDVIKERDSLERRLQLSFNNSKEEISTLRSTVSILNNDKDDLKKQMLSSKNALSEIVSLKLNVKSLIEEKEELKKQSESFKQINKEKENDYNLNINQYKIENDAFRRKCDDLTNELNFRSQTDKEEYDKVLKDKESIETKYNDIQLELIKERNSNEYLNSVINDLNRKRADYDKETIDCKSSLEEKMLLIQQLELMQSKLNEISFKPSHSNPFRQLLIDNFIIQYEQSSIKTKTKSDSLEIQTQTKKISQLQVDKETLTRKVKELGESLIKKNSQAKDNGKIIKTNISTIKGSVISTYEVSNSSLFAIQNKFDDTFLNFNAKILKINKALKALTKNNENSNRISNKEKSMKEVINRLEVEKDKICVKLTNFEFHFKEMTVKLSSYETELTENKTKIQLLQKENELHLKNNRNLEQQIKELQQKVEMYIIENSGKSKIIEERNEEIKQLKMR